MTTNQTPLNPDALEAAARATYELRNPESWARSWEELGPEEREEEWIKPARTAAAAYIAVAQPESTRDQRIALGRLLNKALLQCGISATYALSGPSELYDVAGILLREYPTLAVAQPVVNSVESIPAQAQVISWEEKPEHECWKLAPDETFVGLIVKSDRAWSPADKYTLNIQRPESS